MISATYGTDSLHTCGLGLLGLGLLLRVLSGYDDEGAVRAVGFGKGLGLGGLQFEARGFRLLLWGFGCVVRSFQLKTKVALRDRSWGCSAVAFSFECRLAL